MGIRNVFRRTEIKNTFREPTATEPHPLPDYLKDPNAVLKDNIPSWRYGKAPDYTNTRRVWRDTKTRNHEAGSLADLVENLVKNWEIEASFKRDRKDCRTMDSSQYTFAVNGGPAQSASHMSKVGTYNAIIPPNEYYSPEHSDFNSSHKTFKRMMPTFAWEVLEVYSGPPTVSFKWRHWGEMKSDYVGFNQDGEKVTARAHGGKIDFCGTTIARLTPTHQIKSIEVWYDPLEMFRQICKDTEVTKEAVGRLGKYKLLAGEDHSTHLHGMDDAPQPFEIQRQPSRAQNGHRHGDSGLSLGNLVIQERDVPQRDEQQERREQQEREGHMRRTNPHGRGHPGFNPSDLLDAPGCPVFDHNAVGRLPPKVEPTDDGVYVNEDGVRDPWNGRAPWP